MLLFPLERAPVSRKSRWGYFQGETKKSAHSVRLMTRNRGNVEKRDKKLNDSNNIRKGLRIRLGAIRSE